MTTRTDSASTQSVPKPRFALFVATAAGLGYFPTAPGTFGSLGGLILAVAPTWLVLAAGFAVLASKGDPADGSIGIHWTYKIFDPVLLIQIALTIGIATIGVWSASRAAAYWRLKDPQRVVIDEVSGQHITLLVGCSLPALFHARTVSVSESLAYMTSTSPLNWKYLLVGFILFRLFDIWKPFPARQAETLPSGLGIMADDWVAGLYAGIGLWLARCAGL
jgi:phosphatidylglycerophosphatase A